MSDDQRRAFANLFLLCKPCHTLIDQAHPASTAPSAWRVWKVQWEGRNGEALGGDRPADEAAPGGLVTMVVRAAVGNPAPVVDDTGGVARVSAG